MREHKNSSLSRYIEFADKVTAKFEEIKNIYPKEFQCRQGCHECCKPGLTVNLLEKERIQNYLHSNPEKLALVKKLNQENPRKGKYCGLLQPDGSCSIYEARPIVCRSHGAPLQYKDPESDNFEKAMRYRDVCPLNFKGIALESLNPTHVMNLDTINTLLTLFKKQFTAEKKEVRVPLEPKSFL